jgi:hypothetical protein
MIVTAAMSMHVHDTKSIPCVPLAISANNEPSQRNAVCLVEKHECGPSIFRSMVKQRYTRLWTTELTVYAIGMQQCVAIVGLAQTKS